MKAALTFGLAASLVATPNSLPTLDQPLSLQVIRLTPAGEPLAGAEFQLRQVAYLSGRPLNLTEASSWGRIAEFAGQGTAAQLAKAPQIEFMPTLRTATTGPNGQANFADLDMGWYLVSEVDTPNGYLATEPLWITLPLTHPAGTHWIHDVVIQPKAFRTEPAVGTPAVSTPVSPRPHLTFTGTGLSMLFGSLITVIAAFAILKKTWKRR